MLVRASSAAMLSVFLAAAALSVQLHHPLSNDMHCSLPQALITLCSYSRFHPLHVASPCYWSISRSRLVWPAFLNAIAQNPLHGHSSCTYHEGAFNIAHAALQFLERGESSCGAKYSAVSGKKVCPACCAVLQTTFLSLLPATSSLVWVYVKPLQYGQGPVHECACFACHTLVHC